MALPKRIPIILLRLIALCATLGAVITMITAKETAQVYNMSFKAKYTDSPSFKFFVGVNAIAAGYTLIVIFLPSRLLIVKLLLMLDLVSHHFMYFFCSLALIAN
ncbi:hypothetical protein Leryth_026205 [Lithospermum erythrorhizon]|nr:hypothetical protein Leryth_026205 [Lithospermum erythrorhizon]